MCKILSAKRLKEMIEAQSAEKELNSSTVCLPASLPERRTSDVFYFFQKIFFSE